jgi:hypothetical protein
MVCPCLIVCAWCCRCAPSSCPAVPCVRQGAPRRCARAARQARWGEGRWAAAGPPSPRPPAGTQARLLWQLTAQEVGRAVVGSVCLSRRGSVPCELHACLVKFLSRDVCGPANQLPAAVVGCAYVSLVCRGGNWRGAAGSASQSGGVFGESPPSNHVGWLMGATPPEMNGLYGTSPLYGGSGGSSGKRGGYLSSSPRGGAAGHPSECAGSAGQALFFGCSIAGGASCCFLPGSNRGEGA